LARKTTKSKAPRQAAIPDRTRAKQILAEAWESVLNDDSAPSDPEIVALVNSDLVVIRYCLPTQLLGKLTDPALDTMCLQAERRESGQWDPRSFASKVIAPWVRNNQNVLGTSADPYVSNPLRRPRLDHDPNGNYGSPEWRALNNILADVQVRNEPAHTRQVFTQVLTAVRDRMRGLNFVYGVPPRVSIRQTEDLVARFLAENSGGERGLAVAAGLFETLRQRLHIYQEIRRGAINAADAAAGAAGDLECVGPSGNVVLAVEVKERKIGDADVHIAVEKARAADLREFILCTEGVLLTDQAAVEARFAGAWASGTNLYHATISELIRGVLPIMGEQGIRDFVVLIGIHLDRFNTQPKHRKAWKDLLDTL